MKKTPIIHTLIIVMILIPQIIATEPYYQVVLTLENRNVNPNEKIDFSIDITGNGACVNKFMYIILEGRTNISEFRLSYTNSSDPNNLEYLLLKNITVGPSIDSDCIGQPGLSKRVYIPLKDIKFYEINQIRVDGKLYALPDSEGGDYDFNVLFQCQPTEGKHYYFKTVNQFHVKFWLEQWQYLIQILVPSLIFVGGILFDHFILKKRIKRSKKRPHSPRKKHKR